MKWWSGIACLLVSFSAVYGQEQPATPAEGANLSLNDRYYLVKEKSQTYQDYKVIKEYVLDGFWKITKDSINKVHADLNQAKTKIAQLENDVLAVKNALQQKELSMTDITYESTHISVLGIPFSKGVFIGLVAVITVILVILMLVLLGALRYSRSSLKERALTVDLLTKEFDEYKKKALDKETKILRQLQDERNRYHSSPR